LKNGLNLGTAKQARVAADKLRAGIYALAEVMENDPDWPTPIEFTKGRNGLLRRTAAGQEEKP
jgi:hypothetical protein